jgi:hypothetical protein
MSKVFVLDTNFTPLNPIHSAQTRQLLRNKISTKNGLIQGISHKFCKRIHAKDGYSYAV